MILHLARREWLEQRRHPGMLLVCAVLLGVIAVLVLGVLGLLELIQRDPAALQALAGLAPEADAQTTLATITQITLSAFGFLIYSQYLGFVGVLAGHSLLHDRTHGTLPFLLLAPVRRVDLLLGKVLGALGPLTVIFWTVSSVAGLLAAALPVTALHADLSPRTVSWWVALYVAGPAWAAFVATACTLVSALATDVRLAQQGVWFIVFFVQLLVAFLITGALGSLGAQGVAAGLGAAATVLTVFLGTRVLSRDLGR